MKPKIALLLLLGTTVATLAGPSGADAAPAGRFSVRLDLDGTAAGFFTEISGLGVEVEVAEVRSPDDARVRKRPGKVKYPNITLKRGLFTDPALHEWYGKVLNGVTERKSGSIIYLDREGNEVLRADFFGALPVSILAGPFGGDSAGGPVVESFELAVERVERKKAAPVRGRVPAPRGFTVAIDGAAVAGVLFASAIGDELLPETGDLPPAARARNLVLTCATGSDEAPHDWFGEQVAGADSRKPISISVTPRRGSGPRTYNLLECWPCRWKAPELRAGGDTYIVEELEFAVERVERG